MASRRRLSCDRIRSKRIDELDPLWKQAVERIHLDCQDLTGQDDGFDMAATVVTACSGRAMVQFAGVPVAEVRMMDSDLWGDHQYLLDRPYAEIRDIIKAFVESRCRAQQETSGALVARDCTWVETAEGAVPASREIGPESGSTRCAGRAATHASTPNPGRTDLCWHRRRQAAAGQHRRDGIGQHVAGHRLAQETIEPGRWASVSLPHRRAPLPLRAARRTIARAAGAPGPGRPARAGPGPAAPRRTHATRFRSGPPGRAQRG